MLNVPSWETRPGPPDKEEQSSPLTLQMRFHRLPLGITGLGPTGVNAPMGSAPARSA